MRFTKTLAQLTLIFAFSMLQITAFAQGSNLWSDISESNFKKRGTRQIVPEKYRPLSLNLKALKTKLNSAPLESPTSKGSTTTIIEFPMPDGSLQRFKVVESPMMEPDLAAKFPNIKTYLAQGIDDPYATMRFDVTHKGFHGMILSPSGAVFIDPYSNGTTKEYITYYKKDFKTNKSFQCLVEDGLSKEKIAPSNARPGAFSNGATLRTYRLACAATGEYTTYHGGTVADGQAAIVTTFNRVNQVYENDLAIRLVLVANNDQLIYTDGATDPFDNNNASVLIDQSQTEIDAAIENANYDIGHTVSTGGGGLAGLRIPCRTGQKARGITGSGAPVGDPYDIDYVAHEVGHQFGGNHTFNGTSGSCGGNISGHAYEPGSGSTIQAYAGICAPQNLQSNSDPYFHVESLTEMIDYSTVDLGNSCPVKTATGNTPPVASAPMAVGLTIPINTPFELTGGGTDADGDALTYCWEQYDLGPAGAPESPTGNAPLFRSWVPDVNHVRTFPRLSDLVNNTIAYGEILPSYTRSMEFKLTLRDNRAGGGGVHCAGYSVDVDDSSGPFLVTAPNNAGIVWPVGSTQTITWDVANTTAAPVSCANVDILLSTDGGFTYPVTLATNVANNGSHSIPVPNNPSTTVRIKVICATNIFFDISNQNLEIQVTAPGFLLTSTPTSAEACIPDVADYSLFVNGFGGFTEDVTLSATGLPAGATATFAPMTVTGGTGNAIMTLTSTGVTPGNYTVTVTGTSTTSITQSIAVDFIVLAGAPGSVTLVSPGNNAPVGAPYPTFTWNAAAEATSYEIQVATDPGFSAITVSETGLTATTYTSSVLLAPSTTYYWRVRGVNTCGIGTYSQIYSFVSYEQVCMTYVVTDVPKAISASGTPTVTSTVNIPDAGAILDVNVLNLIGTHSYVSDLTFTLNSPAGTPIILLGGECGNLADFDLNIDDDGTAVTCPLDNGLTHLSSDPLADLNGEDLNGNWSLVVADAFNQDGGSLNGWSLNICYAVEPPPPACTPNAGVLTN